MSNDLTPVGSATGDVIAVLGDSTARRFSNDKEWNEMNWTPQLPSYSRGVGGRQNVSSEAIAAQ